MTNAVDTYKPKKDIKKVYDSELDLKNPAVLKKYQEIVASESDGRNRSLQQSKKRQNGPKVYSTHSNYSKPAGNPGRPSESVQGGAGIEPKRRENLLLILTILLIIAIIIIADLLLYK